MKKIAALVGAGALVLALVVPAMAYRGRTTGRVEIENEDVTVVNKVETKADTGDNSIGGKCVGGGSITTGNASAISMVYNDVNTSEIACRGCRGNVEIENEDVTVRNRVETKADTGDNRIGGKYVKSGTIRTGVAYAYSDVYSLVNYSVVGE